MKLNLQKGFLQVFALSRAFGNSPYSEWVILFPTLIMANSQVWSVGLQLEIVLIQRLVIFSY